MLDLSGNTFYILPLKLSNSDIEELKKEIRSHKGVAVSSIGMHRANVILTCVQSVHRLERHIKTRQAKVVTLEWLNLCLEKRQWLPMDKYEIQLPKLPPQVITICSDDEAPGCSLPNTPKSNSPSPSNSSLTSSAPLQARSLEAIGLAYCRSLSMYSHDRKTMYSSQKSMGDQSDYNTSDEEAELDSSLDADQVDFSGVTQESTGDSSQPKKRGRGFACQHAIPVDYPNKELVEILERMQHFRELDGDVFNAKAYRTAVVALKCYPTQLTRISEVRNIHGIGGKIGRMIQDYIKDGKILEYEELERSPRHAVLDMFYNVHGVGHEVALQWYRSGYRSLEDVSRNERLTSAQKVGIECYHDFLQKMSRDDVEEIVNTLMKQVNSIADGYQHTICGSYRRNCEAMGDIDILITHQNEQRIFGFLSKLLDVLRCKGLVTHVLSASVHNSRLLHADITQNRMDQALVVWQQPGQTIHRRLDIIVTPPHQYYPAILAWTGSKHFEQSLRLYSKKKTKYKVNHHGIFERSTGKMVRLNSERHAFDILGLEYLDPDKRNF
ncbi:hypothetical protein BGW37DRAFT_283990 [Umbelopsis sp. PMI_123]|nr:hypothetical protein BGW37DRAFT_283990 [Umbelopsis sp. PMI_123]